MNNKKNIEKLVSFLGENRESYFLIGGNAAAMYFDNIEPPFRITKDFDIVLVTRIDDSNFSKQIEQFLIEGGYENKYRNNKKTAYRFENPKSAEFPMTIEFFVKEGEFPQSLDDRLAKLDIEVNEEKISAIVLNSDLYEFALRHVIYDYELPIVDAKGLIVLKVFAYFKNLELYQRKLVDRNDYQKHRKDVYRLLTAIPNFDPIEDIPDVLKQPLIDFLPVLQKAKDLAKEYKVEVKTVVETYKKIAQL